MTNFTEALSTLLQFTGAMSVLSGAMAWWRKGSEEEDQVHVDAADLILGTLSDADKVNKTDLYTGKNLREQLTIEEVLELHRERELRGFRNRN